MSLSTRVGLLAGGSVLALTAAGQASDVTQNQELRIAELEAQVAKMSGDNWMTEERAGEIRSLVQDVLADADTRASLLGSGMSGGYDDGFVLGSSDGNFMLRFNGQLQTRVVYNNRDAVDENRFGFENPRTKLWLSGHVFSPAWSYEIEADWGMGGGFLYLQEAHISYDYGNGWKSTIGQFKLPFNHEFGTDSRHLQAIERPLLSFLGLFNAGRGQGVMTSYSTDYWRVMGAYTNGNNSTNGSALQRDTEWAYTVRGEYLVYGNWDQFKDETSPLGSAQALKIGVGWHNEDGENGDFATETEIQMFTVDATFEFDGGNIMAAYYHGETDNDSTFVTDVDFDGFYVQGGWYLNEDTELYARYEWADVELDDDLNVLTVGVNRYIGDHIRVSADVVYGIDMIPFTFSQADVRSDGTDDDGQFAIRGQVEIDF